MRAPPGFFHDALGLQGQRIRKGQAHSRVGRCLLQGDPAAMRGKEKRPLRSCRSGLSFELRGTD